MLVAVPDGSSVEVTLVAAADPTAPVLVIWPAFGAPARFYRQLIRALNARGYSGAAIEWPGRGASTPHIDRHSDFGYHALAADYAPAIIAAVRAELPGAPVHLLGHSLGGHVSCLYAATHPGAVDSVVLVGSASPYFRGYRRLRKLRSVGGPTSMAITARVLGYWPGDSLRFWGRQSRVLVRDWARFSRTGRIEPAGVEPDFYEKALAAAQLDVLTVSIESDPLAPRTAVGLLADKLTSSQVQRWHCPDPVGHIQWVRQHDQILDRIESWLARYASVMQNRPSGPASA